MSTSNLHRLQHRAQARVKSCETHLQKKSSRTMIRAALGRRTSQISKISTVFSSRQKVLKVTIVHYLSLLITTVVTSDPSENPKAEHQSGSNRKSKSLPRESSLSPGMSGDSATTPVPGAPPAPLRDSSPPIKPPQAESKETADPDKSRELEEIRSMVNSLKERNARLERLNQALSVELKDLIAERTSIECKFFLVKLLY
jgi:hypothetical protein